jgi:hypothetical protein
VDLILNQCFRLAVNGLYRKSVKTERTRHCLFDVRKLGGDISKRIVEFYDAQFLPTAPSPRRGAAIANLSKCSDQEIGAIKLALQHKHDLAAFRENAQLNPNFTLRQGLSIGGSSPGGSGPGAWPG